MGVLGGQNKNALYGRFYGDPLNRDIILTKPKQISIVIGEGDSLEGRSTPALVIIDIGLCLFKFEGDTEGDSAEVSHIATGEAGSGIWVIATDHVLVHFDLLGEIKNKIIGDAIHDFILGIPGDGVEAPAFSFIIELISALEYAIKADDLEDETGICFEVSDDSGGIMGECFGVNGCGDEKFINFGDGGVNDNGHFSVFLF